MMDLIEGAVRNAYNTDTTAPVGKSPYGGHTTTPGGSITKYYTSFTDDTG
jgi:hypothetical protein